MLASLAWKPSMENYWRWQHCWYQWYASCWLVNQSWDPKHIILTCLVYSWLTQLTLWLPWNWPASWFGLLLESCNRRSEMESEWAVSSTYKFRIGTLGSGGSVATCCQPHPAYLHSTHDRSLFCQWQLQLQRYGSDSKEMWQNNNWFSLAYHTIYKHTQ